MQTQDNASLTPALLREMASAKAPCITVAVQTGANPRVRLRDAMRQLEQELKTYDSTLPDGVFEPLRDLLTDQDGVTSPGSLVIFSSPDAQYRFTSHVLINEIIEVGETFHLRSVLPLLSEKVEFYLLALSQNHTRLIHCTESESGEVALGSGTPLGFTAATGGFSADAQKGVGSGTSTDGEAKDEALRHFFRALDRSVNAELRGSGLPLVAVGVEHELALYKSVNTYEHYAAPGVHGAPDGLKGGEMHRRALELLRSRPTDTVRHVLDGFEKNVGTGHASHHAHEIVRAAHEGRVSHLFLQETAEYRGSYDEFRDKLKRHGDELDRMVDLLNEAAVETLRHGGDVTLLSAKDMPNGVPVCAVFRYAAPELQRSAQGAASPA